MSTGRTDDFDEFRAKVRDLAERFRTDPVFRDRVRADPRGTLAAAGLPGADVRPHRRDDPSDEVAGYMRNDVEDMSFEVVDPAGKLAMLC